MQRTMVVFLTLACLGSARAEVVPLNSLSRSEQEARIAGDLRAVAVYRQGLLATSEFARRQNHLFPAVKASDPRLPRREEKEVLWQTWKSHLDYLLALDALEHYHREFFRLSAGRRDRSYAVRYAAFLAQYRSSLEFIAAADKNPFLDTILNEPVPELGLPADTYAKVKFRFLHVTAATEFAARSVLYRALDGVAFEPVRKGIEADRVFIRKMGLGKGEVMTAQNALKVVQRAGDTAWFPVQSGVAEWMGDVKVHRVGRSLISPVQIQELQARLLPGDVLLERREWYLSNIGLPGFWPHAALYIGTAEERRRFFAEPEVADWVRAQGVASGDFEDLLRIRYAAAYAGCLRPQEKGHVPRVLEAMSEGVVFTTIEHSADADAVVALRPRLPKTGKAAALLRAFHYAGRPYDFNFDFATDAELVCTELVFKAYEPAGGMRGLQFPLVDMLGRKVMPANEIVRQFDEQCNTPAAQFDFVTFLDGYERQGQAVPAGVEDFRRSWRRPKWHILVQDLSKLP